MTTELEQIKQDVSRWSTEIQEIREIFRESIQQANLDRQQADRDRVLMREIIQQANLDRQQADRDRALMREIIQQADRDRQQADRDRQQADRDRAMITSAIQVIADMAAEMRSLRVDHDRVIQHLFDGERDG